MKPTFEYNDRSIHARVERTGSAYVIWTVPPPGLDPSEARLELARRHLHIFGPSTPEAFAGWAGIAARDGVAAFDALRSSLTSVRTPVGDAWILPSDEAKFRAAPGPTAPTRLLPSDDAYFLLQGDDRELLVPDGDRRPRSGRRATSGSLSTNRLRGSTTTLGRCRCRAVQLAA